MVYLTTNYFGLEKKWKLMVCKYIFASTSQIYTEILSVLWSI